MKITPTQYHVLYRMQDIPTASALKLPQGSWKQPYGKVIAVGPQCTFVKVGDNILINNECTPVVFTEGGDERYIVPESYIFAVCDPAVSQDGHSEPKILKNPPEEN